MRCPFAIGDTITFEPKNFNPYFWDNLSEEDRVKYYSDIGYGSEKPVLFTFICEHKPQDGHCLLYNFNAEKMEAMRHWSDFRKVEDHEC
jgi:hypothetical protein